ncbi:hypothetical protein V8B55DRAFT_1484152 [Mucor lusitanicus]|uniref:Uncharacterized protein n=1 Tax=Mucor circinelloides f. lusitanicus TaxID=29924 RepID=A0A8H4EXI6_MUCCL|nr:hypothetical protein FB192DRAFT_1028046 [Mucor lusitanicus]
MTSDSADNKDKKEAAGFFSRWMSSDSKGDGWDEVCLQWCKQKSAARTENADPNCSMLCFKRPVSADAVDANEKWNPLKGYTVSVVNGKNECADHTSGMSATNQPLQSDSSKEETEYKLDLGDVWTEADVKAKQIINDKVVPLYNSTIEQAVAFKDSPEAVQLQEYLKSKSTELLSQIYPMAPFKLNGKPSSDDPADENK